MIWVKTAIEALFGVALIIGFINEDKFIRFEENFSRKRQARKNKYGSYNPCEGLFWR